MRYEGHLKKKTIECNETECDRILLNICRYNECWSKNKEEALVRCCASWFALVTRAEKKMYKKTTHEKKKTEKTKKKKKENRDGTKKREYSVGRRRRG